MNKILIVDDSSTARMIIKRCLEIAGCPEDAEITEASNGEEAWKKISESTQPFKLVISDLNMPVMGGQGLIGQIKGSAAHRNTAVVVITSADNPAKEKELKDMGVAAVLSKPVSPATIAAVIPTIFGGR